MSDVREEHGRAQESVGSPCDMVRGTREGRSDVVMVEVMCNGMVQNGIFPAFFWG